MPLINQIFRFIVSGTYKNETCISVDYRRLDSLPGAGLTEAIMSQAYWNLYRDNVLPAQHTEFEMTRVQCDNLTDGVSFGEFSGSENGTQTGEGLPAFVAWGVRLNRDSKITRNGSKRLAGVSEGLVNGNSIILSTVIRGDIEDFYSGALQFDHPGSSPDLFTMECVIVGRTKNMSGIYELDLSKINEVDSAQFLPYVTTQNTRKYRG